MYTHPSSRRQASSTTGTATCAPTSAHTAWPASSATWPGRPGAARIIPHRLRRAWHPVLRLRAHARRPARPAAGAPRPTGPA